MDGSRQFHLSLPLPPGFFSAFRLSADIYEDTNRGSQQGSRRPCVVCLSPLSRYLYDRENVSLALTRTDRKQSVIAPWKNADETEPARARVSRHVSRLSWVWREKAWVLPPLCVLPDVVTCSRELLEETNSSLFLEKLE